MRTKHLFILVYLLILPRLTAQNGEDARAILDKTYRAYQVSEGIQLSFTTSSLDQNGNPNDTQIGEAYIKGDKFKLEMGTMDIWFDGTTQWVLMKEANEVNISQPNEQELASISPMALLGMYKTGYSLKKPVPATINGKNSFLIEMIPLEKNRDFKAVSVAIDKITHTLVQATLTFNNGFKSQIDITKYNANYHYPDSEFTFKASDYPGVEIVDLR